MSETLSITNICADISAKHEAKQLGRKHAALSVQCFAPDHPRTHSKSLTRGLIGLEETREAQHEFSLTSVTYTNATPESERPLRLHNAT